MTGTPRVLICDDESDLLDLYDLWLADVDVTVVRASGGAEALSRCDDDIDAAVLDRNMPRVSGDEVLDELRDRSLDIPVAFVSAATPSVRIVDLDIDAYLTKPVTREEYVDLVRSLIKRESIPETAARYLSYLSKRAALSRSDSRPGIRDDSTYAAFEEDLSRLAAEIEDLHLDDPYLRRTLPDGGVDPVDEFELPG